MPKQHFDRFRRTGHAEVLEVVYSLGIDELDEIVHRPPIELRQVALEGDVIVLGGTTDESPLKRKQELLNCWGDQK